ncbi:MAG TPA: AbrB/MazE/SpoVT family DNA-binding domain-containing protein [Patescibacteria group bacterium]|nr:AbrB/MazE/SpoVT family DNA-binding domain-containing protein [Patescibacteria group bacterium]
MNYILDIRDRRQVTIPAKVLEKFGLNVGDKLALKVEGKKAEMKPVREMEIENVRAIAKAFRKAKISEKELLESGERVRKRLVKEKYGEI